MTALLCLTGRKFGIHQDVVFVHATTLEEAQYKLKLTTRMTNTAYKHCILFPIHGTGQGLTNLPMILTFISCTLFDCHTEKSYTMVITDPRGDIFMRLNMVGFVDNSTSILSGDGNDTVKSSLRESKTRHSIIAQLTLVLWRKIKTFKMRLSFYVLQLR